MLPDIMWHHTRTPASFRKGTPPQSCPKNTEFMYSKSEMCFSEEQDVVCTFPETVGCFVPVVQVCLWKAEKKLLVLCFTCSFYASTARWLLLPDMEEVGSWVVVPPSCSCSGWSGCFERICCPRERCSPCCCCSWIPDTGMSAEV